MRFRENLEQRARNLKAETFALYLTARDPRTPSYAKLFVAAIVAYALSPGPVLDDCRRKAQESLRDGRPTSRTAAVVIIVIWLALAALGVLWAYKAFAWR